MQPHTLLLKNARLIDGTGAPPVAHQDILIERGKIARIGPNIDLEARTIDVDGATVMPGLTDAHIHLEAVPGSYYRNDDADALWQARQHHLRAYVACGVTSVLDTGISHGLLRKVREHLANGGVGPKVYALGPLLHPPKGYGDALVVDQWGPLPCSGTPEEIRRQFDAFGDIEDIVGVKMVLESGMGPFKVWALHSETLRNVVVEEAAERSLPIYIHAMKPPEQHIGLTMGVHCFAHPGFGRGAPTEAFIDEIKSKGIYIHSTLAGTQDAMLGRFFPERLSDPLIQLTVPEAQRTTAASDTAWKETMLTVMKLCFPKWIPTGVVRFLLKKADLKKDFQKQHDSSSRAIKTMYEAGIPIVAGTDSGCWPLFLNTFHGPGTLRELALLVEAGMKPMDVISSATRIPAEMMGRAAEFGTIEAGKRADLIVTEGDPLKDITALRELTWCIKEGDARTPAEWMSA